MEELEELQESETIIEKVKGDYWEKFLFTYEQKRGEFTITDKRIIFKGGFATTFSINYEDIESVTKCNVGPLMRFIPTGISIKLKDKKEYRMSVLGRDKYIEIIQSRLNK